MTEVEVVTLEDGKDYTVVTTVTDKAGNTTVLEETVTTPALVAGTISFTEEQTKTTFAPATTAPAQATDKVWVNENVIADLTNGNAGTTTYTVTKVGGTASTPYNKDTIIETTDGDYIVTITTTDGTNTETVNYYFSVDKILPTVTCNPNGKDYTYR